VLALLIAVSSLPAQAEGGIRAQRVQFAKGATSAVINNGKITCYQSVDYLLGVAQGQYMNVSVATDNTASYFNILAPGETEVAFFTGSTSANQYEGVLPATDDCRIRVYMMRSAARRNEQAAYRVEMILTGKPHASAATPRWSSPGRTAVSAPSSSSAAGTPARMSARPMVVPASACNGTAT
jgi:hypothetical protein